MRPDAPFLAHAAALGRANGRSTGDLLRRALHREVVLQAPARRMLYKLAVNCTDAVEFGDTEVRVWTALVWKDKRASACSRRFDKRANRSL